MKKADEGIKEVVYILFVAILLVASFAIIYVSAGNMHKLNEEIYTKAEFRTLVARLFNSPHCFAKEEIINGKLTVYPGVFEYNKVLDYYKQLKLTKTAKLDCFENLEAPKNYELFIYKPEDSENENCNSKYKSTFAAYLDSDNEQERIIVTFCYYGK